MTIEAARLGVYVGAEGVDKTKGELKGFSNSLKSVGKTAAIMGAGLTATVTAPLLMLGNKAIEAASDTVESMNKVDVVFGTAAAGVKAFADSAAQNLGISKAAALEAAGTFGNMFDAMGMTDQASAELSESILSMSADLASFNNIEPDIMLEKLRSGLVGEVEPLRQVGILLSADAVAAKAMEMGLAGTRKELTEADKVQARYALILEQSTNAAGDFARTSEDLANATRIQNAMWEDTVAMLGETLLPIKLQFVEIIQDLIGRFQALDPGVREMIVKFGGLAAILGPLLIVLGSVAGAVAAIGAPVLAVVAAVGLLAAAWVNDWGGIQTKTMEFWAAIQPTLETLRAWLEEKIPEAVEYMKGVWSDLTAFFSGGEMTGPLTELQGKFNEISNSVRRAWAQLVDFFAPTIERLKKGFAGMMEGMAPLGKKIGPLGEAFARLGEALAPVAEFIGVVLVAAFNLLLEVVAAVMPSVGEIIGNVVDAVTIFIDTLAEVITGLVDLVMALIEGDWTAAWEAAQGIVSAWVDGVTGIFGEWFDTVSIIFNDMKEAVGNWVANLSEQSPAVAAAVETMSAVWNDTLLPAIEAVSSFFTDTFFPTIETLVDWFTGAGTTAVDDTASLWNDTLKPAFEAVWGFIDENLIPIFEALYGIHMELMRIAIEALTLVWNEQLKPALDTIWLFIKDNLVPVFEAVVEVTKIALTNALNGLKTLLKITIGPALEIFKGIINSVAGAFNSVSSAISSVIGWLQRVKDKLASISIPSWITQHSPSPIEQAFLDLGKAVNLLATDALPAFIAAFGDVDTKKIKEMATAIQAVTRATSGLLGFAIDLGEFTTPDESYQGAIDWLVDFGKRIAEAVQAIDFEFEDEFVAFAKNLKAAFGPLMDAMKFVAALRETDWLEPGTIPNFVPWLASITGQVTLAIDWLREWTGMDAIDEEFNTFVKNLKGVFGPLMDAMKFVAALRETDWLTPGTIPNFVPWLASITGQVTLAIDQLREWTGMDAIDEEFNTFVKNLKGVFGPLMDAMKFVAALRETDWLKPGTIPNFVPWLASITGQVTLAIDQLREWTGMDAIDEEFNTFVKNLKGVFGPLMDAIDFVRSIEKLPLPKGGGGSALVDYLAAVAGLVGQALVKLQWWEGLDFGEEFQTFAANLQAAFGPLMDAVDFVRSLEDFKPPEVRVPTVIKWLAKQAKLIGQEVIKLQNQGGLDFDEEFQAFTANLEAAFGPLMGASDLMRSLRDFRPVTRATMRRFVSDAVYLFKEFRRMIDTEFSEEAAAVTNAVSEAMGNMASGMSGMFDLFIKLTGSDVSAYSLTERFKTNLQQVIKAIDVTMNAFKIYVEDRAGNEWIPTANNFYDSMSTVLGILGDALSLFDMMHGAQIPSASRITAIVDAIMQMYNELSVRMYAQGRELGGDLLGGIADAVGEGRGLTPGGGRELAYAYAADTTIRHEVKVTVSSPDCTVSREMVNKLADALVERIDLNG